MGIVNRNMLVADLCKLNQHLDSTLIEKAVDVFFDEIMTALVCGDRVELRGFASWVVRKRQSKTVRNPRTNKKLVVGDKGSLYFRPSRELLKRINPDMT